MGTILLSGAHGVGKGYFLEKVKNDIKNYKVVSGSGLIGQYRCATDGGYKKVTDVRGDQDVLVQVLKSTQEKERRNIILDGHICVFNAEGSLERIPEEFFGQADIVGIVILQDSPEVIVQHLNERDTNKIKAEDIEKMQTEENEYAKELEKKYLIPYRIITHVCDGRVLTVF